MLFCAGTFPDIFEAKVPLVYPAKILNGLARALSKNSNINVLRDSGLRNVQPVCRLSIIPGLAQDQESIQPLI